MGDERFHVYEATSQQLQCASCDSLGIRDRAEDVEVTSDDLREVDAAELNTRARRTAEDDAAAAARKRDAQRRTVSRTSELDHKIELALALMGLNVRDH